MTEREDISGRTALELTETRSVDGLHRLLDLVQNGAVPVQSLRAETPSEQQHVRLHGSKPVVCRGATAEHIIQINVINHNFLCAAFY